ncbi:MAG: polyprenyl diphosphate synthase [Armatimonadota bacterium]|jgi:undecaprenyl diphosphate synthase
MTEDEAREAVKALDRLPRHIAVIMDGNGRWAQEHDLPREQGHLAGRNATRRLVDGCGEAGIQVLTIYSFSAENWSRPDSEVQALMQLIETSLKEEIDELDAQQVRFMASGRLQELPRSLQEAIRSSTERTASNTGLVLNVAVNYGGRTELVDACRALAARAAEGKLDPAGIDEDAIRAELYAPDLPDPDLVIRTGGDMRISNFLIWQVAYAELCVLRIFWPDFQKRHLFEALRAYAQRDRRFGRIQPSL